MAMDKIYAFDYMITLLNEWREAFNTGNTCRVLSKLSVLKLLFFFFAPKKDGGEDLLNVFDNFHALPYGPVESDIYNAIQNDCLPSYIVSDRMIQPKNTMTNLPYNVEDFDDIRRAVNELRHTNESLIKLNAFELVEITHKWESWKQSINFAKLMDMSSYKMTVEPIRNDRNKYFE